MQIKGSYDPYLVNRLNDHTLLMAHSHVVDIDRNSKNSHSISKCGSSTHKMQAWQDWATADLLLRTFSRVTEWGIQIVWTSGTIQCCSLSKPCHAKVKAVRFHTNSFCRKCRANVKISPIWPSQGVSNCSMLVTTSASCSCCEPSQLQELGCPKHCTQKNRILNLWGYRHGWTELGVHICWPQWLFVNEWHPKRWAQ